MKCKHKKAIDIQYLKINLPFNLEIKDRYSDDSFSSGNESL